MCEFPGETRKYLSTRGLYKRKKYINIKKITPRCIYISVANWKRPNIDSGLKCIF